MFKLNSLVEKIFKSTLVAFTFLLVLLGTINPTPALAQGSTVQCGRNDFFSLGEEANCLQGSQNFQPGQEGIVNFIIAGVNIFIGILAAVAVAFIVYGGFLFVTDDGSGTKAEKGKKIVLYALAGLVVALISFTLVSVVGRVIQGLDISGANSRR